MLNKTHLEHTVFALIIQLALWPLVGLGAAGLFAVAIFIGREIAQAEFKVRARTGRSLTDMMRLVRVLSTNSIKVIQWQCQRVTKNPKRKPL